MKYGLKENIIRDIQNVFATFPQIEEVILYGSRAKGNFKPGSDIDLAIKGEKVNLEVINKIDCLLDDMLLPYTFDISIFNHIKNGDLLNHINRVGIVFFSKSKERIASRF